MAIPWRQIVSKGLGFVLGFQVIGFTALGILASLHDPKPGTCLILFLVWWLPTGAFCLLLAKMLWFGR